MATDRDPGWYWVWSNELSNWYVAELSGNDTWYFTGEISQYGGPGFYELYTVGPRIPEPEEV